MTTKPPILSVIIASVNGLPMIQECLAALDAQEGDIAAEVIVMDVVGGETLALIKRRFPWVTVVSFAEHRTIPQLRAAGLVQSRGQIIAIIEDHCNPDRYWYVEIVNAHLTHPEFVAVGGLVENGCPDRIVDWAVFFCEYSTYMGPRPRGISEDIPGNNVSYKRRAFECRPEDAQDLDDALKDGFWESTLHPKLLKRGDRFFLEPSIVVCHKKEFGFRYFLHQRYHYSRYYAGTICSSACLAQRAFRGAASLALPPVLMYRIASRVMKTRRHQKEFLLAAPLMVVFTGAWAVGESVGCLFGAGSSLEVVE